MKLFKINPFLRSVATLSAGTTIAQAIPALISPILTRIYSPEDFGVLAVFMSLTAVFSVLTTGKYELAIVLPKKDEQARKLVRLSLVLTAYSSLILIFIFFLGHEYILRLIDDKNISFWLYLVPLSVFLTAAFEVYRYYSIRHSAYKTISRSTIIKSGTSSVSQVAIGLLSTGPLGLLLGNILSLFTGNISLKNVYSKNSSTNDKESFQLKSLKDVADRYKKFPKFTLPSSFLNSASLQLPIFFLTTFFSNTIVGFYALTQRVLNVPMLVIGNSIGQVFYQKSSEYKNNPRILKILTWSLYKDLLKIGIFPLAIIMFFGKEIFSFVFSAQWEVAGSYAQILSVWIFFVFISSPISNLLFVQERQKEALILQIVIFVSRLMVLSACALFHLNAFQTVFYFGLTGALIFFGFIFYLLSSIGIKKTKIIKHSFFTIILGVLPIFLFKKFIWSLL